MENHQDIMGWNLLVVHKVLFSDLCYSLFISMILGVTDNLVYVLFAGNTNVFLNGKDMNTLIGTIPLELSNIYVWLLANKFTLRIS